MNQITKKTTSKLVSIQSLKTFTWISFRKLWNHWLKDCFWNTRPKNKNYNTFHDSKYHDFRKLIHVNVFKLCLFTNFEVVFSTSEWLIGSDRVTFINTTVLHCNLLGIFRNIHWIFLKYIVLWKSVVLLIIDIVLDSFFVSYPPPPPPNRGDFRGRCIKIVRARELFPANFAFRCLAYNF
jgi:hypothetical protein